MIQPSPKFVRRVLDKVRLPIESDGRWEWTAAHSRRGYAQFQAASYQNRGAHVVLYELLVGPVPDGLELDHICRNHGCVNPFHLEAVTHKINLLRGKAPAAINARKTHGDCGHPLFGENLYLWRGRRECLTCRRAKGRLIAAKRRVRKGYFAGRRRTHCPHGHELTDDNLDAHMLSKGYRACKACKRERNKLYMRGRK